MKNIRNLLAVILLCLGLMMVPPVGSSLANGPAAGKVSLNFKDVELVDLIKTISELTGRNFIYDNTVKGTVTIISPKSMSKAEAYNLFKTVLHVKGFTIVQSGKVYKIRPTRSAKEENLPVISGEGLGEQFITRLIPLKSADANVLANTILRPLLPKTSHVVAYAPTNTLIVTDSAANIEKLFQIVETLDREADLDGIEILSLQYADAVETSQIANEVLGGGAVAGQPRGKVAVGLSGLKGKIIPYARTNRLILLGGEDFVGRVKAFITDIDQKADETRSRFQVFYLEHAEAEVLAGTLNTILTGMKTVKPAAGKGVQEQASLGTVTITSDKPTNSLIINATPKDYDVIREIVAKLDIKRKQVFVEALILEVSLDMLKDIGASLQGGVDTGSDSVVFGTSNLNTGRANLSSLAPPTGSSTPAILSQAIDGILLGGLFNPITTIGPDGSTITIPALSALIDLSQTETDLNVLSAPRLLTSDNEEAEIVVGSNVPIITSRSVDNAGNPINSVERKDVALTLRFTPQVTEGNQVRMKIFQEISDVAPSNANVGDPSEVGPSLDKRLLQNTVIVEDGRTVVLGGLFQTNRQESLTKVPLLGDIPLLGALFRRKNETESKTSLLIFITPRIIRSSEDLEQVTRQNRQTLNMFRENRSLPEDDSAEDLLLTPLEPFRRDVE